MKFLVSGKSGGVSALHSCRALCGARSGTRAPLLCALIVVALRHPEKVRPATQLVLFGDNTEEGWQSLKRTSSTRRSTPKAAARRARNAKKT